MRLQEIEEAHKALQTYEEKIKNDTENQSLNKIADDFYCYIVKRRWFRSLY